MKIKKYAGDGGIGFKEYLRAIPRTRDELQLAISTRIHDPVGRPRRGEKYRDRPLDDLSRKYDGGSLAWLLGTGSDKTNVQIIE